MFGLGAGELIIIAIVALLMLGPDKLPDAAKKIGQGIRDLKRQTRDLQDTIEQDTQIGEAMRDFKAALRGDESPSRPSPPVRKPERPIPPAATTVVRPEAGQPMPPALERLAAAVPTPTPDTDAQPDADTESASAVGPADDEPDSSAHG